MIPAEAYGGQPETVRRPGDFRRRGPDGPPWVSSPDKTRKPKGNKPELLAKAAAAGHALPDNPKDITVPELIEMLGPEPADELYQRPSSIGDVLENEFNLIRWKERNLVIGLEVLLNGRRLIVDPDDASALDQMVAQAYEASGGDIHRDRGTHVHLLCQFIDQRREINEMVAETGYALGLPWALQVNVAAQWYDFRAKHGIRAVAIEATCVNDTLKAAGSLDRIDVCDHDIETPFGTIPAGHAFVGDIKTGNPRAKYAAQLAAYAGSVPYDTDTDTRGEWPQPIHQGIGLLYRYDIRAAIDGELVDWEIIPVDLTHGLAGATLSAGCRDWGKTPALADPIQIAVPGEARSERAPVEQPTTGAGTSPSPAPVVNPDTEGEPCDTTSTHTKTSATSSTSTTPATGRNASSVTSTSSPTTSLDETDTSSSSTVTAATGPTPANQPPTSPSPSSSTGASSARRDALLERWRALTPDQRAVYAGLTFDKTDLDAVEAAITTAATGEAFNYVAPVPPSPRDAYMAHLDRCDTCNYDKECMACEIGVPDGETDGPDWHNCNCRHGKPGNGWHLRQAAYPPMPEPDRPVDRATVDTLVDAIRASGHADTINRWMAGHGWSVKARPTVANYERCRVALALAEATGGSDAEAACIIERGAA